MNNRRLDVCTRISYQHVTEQYGYLFNNEYMDNKKEMDIIENKDIVQKSLAFDEYNNRKYVSRFSLIYNRIHSFYDGMVIVVETKEGRSEEPYEEL